MVAKARDILEFCEKNYIVARHLTSRIIGQKGKQIQEIIDKSKVVKVRFPSDQETKEILVRTSLTKEEITKHTVIIFIGTKSNIANAECLMDYLVGSLEEIEKLTDNKNEIEQVWFSKLLEIRLIN